MDNILIYSNNISKHKLHIREVLHRLRTNRLFSHADKCEFHITSCEYLGYMLSPEVVTSECTALLGRRSGFGGVSDSGFSSCAEPTSCGSKYFYNQCPRVQNLIRTECSLNISERRVKKEAS